MSEVSPPPSPGPDKPAATAEPAKAPPPAAPAAKPTAPAAPEADEKAAPEADDGGVPDADARNRMRGAASGYFTFQAGVAGLHAGQGDVYNNFYAGMDAGGPKYRPRPLDPARRDKINAVYVPPPAYELARKRLEDQAVLVLHGDTALGKFSAALHMLANGQRSFKLFEINGNIDLGDEQALPIEDDSGYLIEKPSAAALAKLNAARLRHLNDSLMPRHSRLILVIDTNTTFDSANMHEFVVAWKDALPDRNEIFRRHLRCHLGQAALSPDAVALCDAAEVQVTLDCLALAEIDQFAQSAAEVVRGNVGLAELLGRYSANIAHQVDSWFASHPQLEQRTRLIAIAVFHGARYSRALEAGQDLLARLTPPPADDTPPPPPAYFDTTRASALAGLGARLETAYETTEVGPTLVEKVYLKNPALQWAILKYVWEEFDGLREILLDWLYSLGASGSYELSGPAAAAIGALSACDFRLFYNRVIFPWAIATQPVTRAQAALALDVLADRPEYTQHVLDLLRSWVKQPENWRLRWTAALVYGWNTGLRQPDEALWQLYELAKLNDRRFDLVICSSVAELFAAGQSAEWYYGHVLAALDAWTHAPRPGASAGLWLQAFATIARDVKHSPRNAERWPTLLWLCATPKYHAPIRSLWQRTLQHMAGRPIALAALRDWLQAAERTPALAPTLTHLLADLYDQGDARGRQRLRLYLNRWADWPKQPCQLARQILEHIDTSTLVKEVFA